MSNPDVVQTEHPTIEQFRRIHLIASRLLVAAVMGQIALGVIELRIHEWTGTIVGLLSIVVAVAGVRGRFSRSTTGLGVAAAVLVCLQGAFIALADAFEGFAIAHLIDGFIIFGLAIVLAIESEDEGREPVRL